MKNNIKKGVVLGMVCLVILVAVLLDISSNQRGPVDRAVDNSRASAKKSATAMGMASQNPEMTLRRGHLPYVTPSSGVRARPDPRTRSDPTASDKLPPDGTPWAETFKELEPLAENGSIPAAKRLYEDTYRCLKFHALPAIITGEAAAFNVPESSSSVAVRAYASRLDKLGKDTEQLSAMCGSTNAVKLKQVLPNILEKAAQLGVHGAATCYVSGHLFPYSQTPSGQAYLSKYRHAAGQIIRAALANGNWRMLHLLTHASDERSVYASSWVPSLLGNDARVLYGLNRLEMIGASGQEASDIQSKLLKIISERGLSQQKIRSLDEWAEQMYSNYFKGKPRDDLSGGACPLQ